MVATRTVRIGPCLCPGTPHPEGDMVALRERLDFVQGRSIQALAFVLREEELPVEVITARLDAAYLENGAVSWNLVDEKGQPVPLNVDTIREHILSDYERAAPAVDEADEMYAPAVIHPLVKRAANSSPSPTIDESTSATSDGSPEPTMALSSPSSTSTTPMEDTAEITG